MASKMNSNQVNRPRNKQTIKKDILLSRPSNNEINHCNYQHGIKPYYYSAAY